MTGELSHQRSVSLGLHVQRSRRVVASATVLLGAIALAGCVSFPERVDVLPTVVEATDGQEKAWSAIPALRSIPTASGSRLRSVEPLPSALAAKPLKLRISGPTSLGEIVGALEAYGIRAVMKAPAEKLGERLRISDYDGVLGQFLDILNVAHDLDYEFANGVIVISSGVRHMVTVPQNKALMERITPALEAYGAMNVKSDIDTGLLTYNAPRLASTDIDLYLKKLLGNASMVALQVAVIDVRLNRDRGTGFDWNEFTAKWGTALGSTLGTPTPTPAVPGTPSPTTPTTSVTRVLGSLAKLSGNGVALQIEEAKFSLAAAVKLLSTYGQAKTTQDVLISTLGGAPVKISSGTQIPYVSGLGAVTAAGGAVSGSVNTSTVKSGLSIDITPRYDAGDNLVITDVKAKLSSLVRFRELSAGNSVGTLSQPEIQELEFENISRLRPGEIVMLGGISYDMVSENYTGLSGIEKAKLGSEVLTTNRHAIFIVIRPSVTVFTEAGGADGAQTLAR